MTTRFFLVTTEVKAGIVRYGRATFQALLAILLLSGAGLSFASIAPIVDDFNASPATVAPGGTVVFTVQAHDPDCPDICTDGCGLYIRSDLTGWSATGGTFTLVDSAVSGSPYTSTADWLAPDTEGTYTISVYLADSGSFMCGGRGSITPTIDILVTNNPNQSPVVESLTANPTQMFPGQNADLLCVASDPDGDPVTYTWATDSGTVAGGVEGAATFTAGDVGIATVTCTVTDSGGFEGADSIGLAIVGATAERSIQSAVMNPRRLAVDSFGLVYVVDRGVGGISVVDLAAGRMIYKLAMPEITSVAVNWDGNLLVGGDDGARLIDRAGQLILQIESGAGQISDVALDALNRRYGVLHRTTGRVVIYDEFGAQVGAFGSTGDGSDQVRSPMGLAVTPTGEWVVADTGHGLIKIFNLGGTLVSAFGGLGGGAGEFVRLDDVAVDSSGVIFASDTFQSRVQAFNPDGSPREVLGTYGEETGQFKTPTGVVPVEAFDRLVVASYNASSLEVFRTSDDPVIFPAPALGVASPSLLIFPTQAIGTVSGPQAVTLENLGEIPLGIERVTVEGDFLQSNDCGSFVEPGGTCVLQVSFRPETAGSLVGAMTVAASGEPGHLSIDLNGAGYLPEPIVNLAPTALAFGPQEVGTMSAPLPVNFSNSGDAPLEIFAIAASADYLQTNVCPNPLVSGGSCTINVVFAPTAVSDHIFGTLTVTTDAGDSPHSVSLDGQGMPNVPVIAVDDPVVEEGSGRRVGASALFTVSLSEPTTETVTIDYTTVSDTAVDGEDFIGVTGTLVFGGRITGTDLTGRGWVEQIVKVEVLADELLEADEEYFDLVLSNPVNAEFGDDIGRATILDDEQCLGPNLVANPSAEARPDGPGIPDWYQVLGDLWHPRGAPPQPVDGDFFFFSGTTENAELQQDIDVSAFADSIGRGRQVFVFDAWVRSLYEKAETARVVVEYRDWWNGTVLDAFDTDLFGSPTGWLHVYDERPAPPGTQWIRIRLISEFPGDAYFDWISLRSLRALTVGIDDVWEYEGDVKTTNSVFTIRLACPSAQEVTVNFATSDGAAVAGQDYFSTGGVALMPTGQMTTKIAVEVIGDLQDETHEDFFVDLTRVEPADAVLLDPQGMGVIFNDDFCPQEVGYWYDNPDSWLVSWLLIGGVEYDAEPLLKLLGYAGSDASHLLARELVATKLNINAGSKPDIIPVVDEADEFLVKWPPGSQPTGGAKRRARELRNQLNAYNTQACF